MTEHDNLEDLGRLGELIRQSRERLQEGGPPVNYAALYAYTDPYLPKAELQEIKHCINTWKAWNDAYWQIRTLLEVGETEVFWPAGVSEFSRAARGGKIPFTGFD